MARLRYRDGDYQYPPEIHHYCSTCGTRGTTKSQRGTAHQTAVALHCGLIERYAARYNVLANLGNFLERVATRAFDRILGTDPDVVALFNHDANNILGRTSAGTLRLEATDKGLKGDCDPPNTTAGLDTYESIQRGDINGCSFAANLDEDDQQWSKEGRSVVRTIRDFKSLLDVSVVTYRAYPNTLNRLYTELNSLMNKAKHDKADERRMAYLPIIREWVH